MIWTYQSAVIYLKTEPTFVGTTVARIMAD